MRYSSVRKGKFLKRPNRFIAEVLLDDEIAVCHVKNTGRCRELLVPGATVYLNAASSAKRKTKFDLIAVEKQGLLINMDAQAPNQVFREYVEQGSFLPDVTRVRPEYRLGDSRFDFYMEQGGNRHLVEVKGVTLEEEGIVRFPDAPTERGVKHIKGLTMALKEGFTCWICFVIQMSGAKYLMPNDKTHPEFGQALRAAKAAGVHVVALECDVTPDSLTITHEVPVHL